MGLNEQQRALFRHNGFLRLPERLPEETVATLKAAIWDDIRAEVAPVVRDKQGHIVRLSALWERSEIFQEVLASPLVLDALETLLGPNIYLVTNRHNHATLRLAGDGGVYFHRDVLQWSRTIVTVLFYLEETDMQNGCTLVIPGSHLLQGWTTSSVEEVEGFSPLREQAVSVPMPVGGLLAIDSTLIHSAGENHTDGTRMSLTVGYQSVDELNDLPNPKRILVRGQTFYQGNDRS